MPRLRTACDYHGKSIAKYLLVLYFCLQCHLRASPAPVGIGGLGELVGAKGFRKMSRLVLANSVQVRLYLAGVRCSHTLEGVMVAIGASKLRPRILVVDDDTTVVRLLGQALQKEGYETISSQDGAGAIQAINNQHPALIILDINLPKLNGFEVCRKIREASQVPIVFISGRGSDNDKMYAFQVGGDDYVTKPFNLEELMARVRAVLRRSAPMTGDRSDGVFRYADLEINISTRYVRYRGREVSTTPIEFDLLRALVLNAGKVLTHRWLLNQVWGPEYSDEREYLRVHLSHLRRKIEPDPTHPQYIQTVPRIGYRFVPQEEG